MDLTLHTETTIDSCHKLEEYEGKCASLHGHTWKLELWFKGDSEDVDKIGILVDFNIVKEIKEVLDHKYLNDVVGMNPTAENLTPWIYKWVVNKLYLENPERFIAVKVRLYETAVDKQTWCEAGDF